MKILVVDDEDFALRVFETQLRGLGVREVVCCASAAAALARVAGAVPAFDLLFCDLNMPEMDGVELLRQLAREGYQGIVVLVSGEDDRTLQTVGHLAAVRGLGILGALTKPVGLETLRQVLARAGEVTRRTAQRPRAPRYDAQALERALAEGQLVCHYQPKVSLVDGRLVGVETLVRWQHPVDGLVYPDDFVGVAEDHGMIAALTRIVLGEALSSARGWRAAGLDLDVAVNVSMEGLVDLGFPDEVARAAEAAGMPAGRLLLEVTESRLSIDRITLLDIVSRLRLKRVGVSIDDFGTGHSSLAQLRDIPFDELKLDRGFVDGVSGSAGLQAIVEGSITMARQLGLKVTAEGVEQPDDWACLRALGCDLAQGYLVARPMPGDALTSWARGWPARYARLMEAGR